MKKDFLTGLYIVAVHERYTYVEPMYGYLHWDSKNSGVEPWLEINVGRFKEAWFHVGEHSDRKFGFIRSEDATAFKLVFG